MNKSQKGSKTIFGSLLLGFTFAALISSPASPAFAGWWSELEETVRETGREIDPTNPNSEMWDETQASIKICNQFNTQGGSFSFAIDGTDFTLAHGYCQDYTAAGTADITFYQHSYTVGDGSYYFAADSTGYADLFSE